jgi:S-adenosylmethionine-diacylglycerol 3-amino-3-carboxypropyl transferase
MIAVREWFSGRVFRFVHGRNLVYNTCWEDPRLDRIALALRPSDRLVMITSAGCNALDYALLGPSRVDAVDVNPRQNALLELKIAAIRRLEFEDFFALFGYGRLANAKHIYELQLRDALSPWSQRYWDRWIKFFDDPRRTFYFRGASGTFARWIKFYIDCVVKARSEVNAMLHAATLDEQREIYHRRLRERFWTRPLRFAMNRDATLSMVGVPRAQRRQLEADYEGGVVQFVRDCLDAVFGQLPLADNYFWRVYITGCYTPTCCPEYLKSVNFHRLKAGLVDCIRVHTDTLQGFLEKHREPVSRFVLLDHMDWLADRCFPSLVAEWQAIVARASEDARLIWRSGGLRTNFLDRVQVATGGRTAELPELLHYQRELSETLHAQDRVHTYGSFSIADLRL